MGILADADAVGSQLLATVGAAAVIAVCALVWRTWRAIQRMTAHVLPHFVPPTAAQIRDGAEDNTMPARQGRLETHVEVLDAKATVAADSATKVAAELSAHLVEETAAGVVLADTLKRGTERMQALDDGQTAIKEQLTETVRKLGAGNPEWRDDDVHRSPAGEQATA